VAYVLSACCTWGGGGDAIGLSLKPCLHVIGILIFKNREIKCKKSKTEISCQGYRVYFEVDVS